MILKIPVFATDAIQEVTLPKTAQIPPLEMIISVDVSNVATLAT